MDGKRYTSLLLIICFSTFLGHSLVPHHHAEIVNAVTNGECPIDHDDHHDDGYPNYCHAFNSLDFVNYSYTKIQQPVRMISFGLVPVSRVELEQPIAVDLKQNICLKIPDKTTKYIGAISMRAPPVST